ncbi:kinase-like domain-containing protein [Lentinula aff. detonsa]|uniref:Kinase-like domain-containing protein n=2 Tax=Lentinula TaxID=5352 RepID=A0AA38KDI1_9AGAR|nr:kinase-like domain-containing protein [Lentinula aff. detonsa]KAJ3985478.1 kinase-like domain-containing protein [Lentinula detonsa]
MLYVSLVIPNRLHWLRDKLENIVSKVWDVIFGRFIFVKDMGRRDATVEVATMKFIRQHTSIPVPKVLGVLRYRGKQHIFMTRLAGKEIDDRQWKVYSQHTKDAILSQLRSFITQLRQIGPPPQTPPFICNILGGPIMDHRLCVDHPYGPYRDEEQMNLQIRQGLTVDRFAEIGKFPKEVTELIRQSHDLRHPIVFTHNDIAMRNIMIDGDRVTGLIDWECAGWLPAHWEYVKANWTEFYVEEWVRDLRTFIPPFDMENEADRAIGWSRSWMASLDIPFDPSWDLSWESWKAQNL